MHESFCAVPAVTIEFNQLRDLADSCGLFLTAALDIAAARKALGENASRLRHWQQEGFAGAMQYMNRPVELFIEPEALLPGVSSIVSFVISYKCGFEAQVPPPGFGKVARYAWGRDYHRVLKKRLKRLVGLVGAALGSREAIRWRAFADSVPLLERVLPAAGGLGFIGKNSMFIRPGVGSFSFLAEIIWNVEIIDLPDQRNNSVPMSRSSSCGNCCRCSQACPTAALCGDYLLDSRKCISYLTIEKNGLLSEWEAQALGNWLFGCDTCQDVCPFNHRGVELGAFNEFCPDAGVGQMLSLKALFNIRSVEQFAEIFCGTALMRAGREKIVRNACCVAANTRFVDSVIDLQALFREDCSEVVRWQAYGALKSLLPLLDGLDRKRVLSILSGPKIDNSL